MRLPFAGGFARDRNPQRKKLSEQRGGGDGASCPTPGLVVHKISELIPTHWAKLHAPTAKAAA